MLADGDVVRRHQPADGPFGIPQQSQRDRTLLGRQQGQKLLGHAGRQFLEEHRPIVGRHVVQQGGHVFLRHRLQEGLLRLLREVFESRRGNVAGKHAKDDDLILDREVGQHPGQVARGAIPHQIAQPTEIAFVDEGGQLVGRPSDLTDEIDRGVPIGTV